MDSAPDGPVLRTERLSLRRFRVDNAPFLLELLNDDDFLRYIGDRGVRTEEEAREYLRARILASYEEAGIGHYLVRVEAEDAPAGSCGLLKRPGLADPDIGFAFLPAFRGRGYALEASVAVLEHARRDLGIARVVAITARDNERSARLLEKLGLRFERELQLEPGAAVTRLFATDASPRSPRAPSLR